MNLENLPTKIESIKTFNLDRFFDKSEPDKIRNAIQEQIADLKKNHNSIDFADYKLDLTSSTSLNTIADSIQDYFQTADNSWFNKNLETPSLQVKDFQHSGLCSCCSCGGNQATQEGSRFENVSFFNAGGSKWSQPGGRGNPVNITYSFSNLLDGGLNGISAEQAEAAIEEAFAEWANYAPLNFTEVQDSSNVQIRIGYDYIDGSSNTLAFAYFPGSSNISGDITFDSGERWNTSLFLETAVHEIGHSLGLDHESGTNAIMNPTIQNRYSGLGSAFLYQDDINGIRNIYGSGTGSVTPLGGNPTPTPEPTPTPTAPQEIYGTMGNDVLVGNDRNNKIRGFAGDDYIEGGKGNDDIRGGKGADVFAFNSLNDGLDTIKDFSLAEGDTIQVSRAGFGSSSGFTYNQTTGNLSFNNEQFIFLENKPSFSDVASSFVIF